jgi:hypothetical protein
MYVYGGKGRVYTTLEDIVADAFIVVFWCRWRKLKWSNERPETNRNRSIFPPLALKLNSGLGRLYETFRFTSFTRSRTVGRTPWTGDQLVARLLPVHKHRKTHSWHKSLTSMPWVGFEPTVPMSARAKTIPYIQLILVNCSSYKIIPWRQPILMILQAKDLPKTSQIHYNLTYT